MALILFPTLVRLSAEEHTPALSAAILAVLDGLVAASTKDCEFSHQQTCDIARTLRKLRAAKEDRGIRDQARAVSSKWKDTLMVNNMLPALAKKRGADTFGIPIKEYLASMRAGIKRSRALK